MAQDIDLRHPRGTTTAAEKPKDVVDTLAAGSWVFAALLAMAGFAKVTAPAATSAALQGARLPGDARLVRLLGTAEIFLAAAVLIIGGPVFAAAMSVAYGTFAVFAWRQSRKGEGCGCFGESTAPATRLHVGIDVIAALMSGSAVLWPVGSPVAEAGSGAVALLLTALVLVGAVLLRLSLTALPELAAAVGALATPEVHQ